MRSWTPADVHRREEGKPAQPKAPASFYCPVSMDLMTDPVMVDTGHTYDRICIERWLQQGNRTCPVTGMRLRHLELVANHALRNAIQVRCWREGPTPLAGGLRQRWAGDGVPRSVGGLHGARCTRLVACKGLLCWGAAPACSRVGVG